MFFKGLLITLTCFSAIVCTASLINLLDLRFSRFVRPLFPYLGLLLLFIALWPDTLFFSVLICSAALTFFYAAYRLKPFGGFRCGSCHGKSKGRPRF